MTQPVVGPTQPSRRAHPDLKQHGGEAAQRSPGMQAAQPSAEPDPVPPSLPTVTLPTGGGAIRGIDEKLTVALATGTAGLAIPIATTPCRHGFGPTLSLSYDSGAGNGPFGLGWRLSAPSITRKTARGLPKYDDTDVYLLSDAEDLVPALVSGPDGGWIEDSYHDAGITIRRYRPRVEQAFTRIERWTEDATGDVHWRTTTRENVTSLYGRTAACRIADPADPARVFSWLLEISYDGKGNAVGYEYKPEDTSNVPASVFEAHRAAATNKYLKVIRYGPTAPYHPAGPLPACAYRLVLDYGEHDPATPTPAEAVSWPVRPDSFSTYRGGFEIRTRRRCRRLLMFHSFPELGPDPVLVSSTDLTYTVESDPALPAYSLLTAVTRSGYLRDGAGYRAKSLPAVSLGYSSVTVGTEVEFADADALANLPVGVDDNRWQWADLDGEGLQGVLTSDAAGWYYKRNVSAYRPDPADAPVRFEPLRLVASKPGGTAAAARLSLIDLHSDGVLAAADFSPPLPGYHTRTADGGWSPFVPFPSTTAVDLANPNVRRLDLDGDGLADLLMTSEDAFTWFAWQAGDGYAPGGRAVTSRDEESGPALVLAHPDGAIFTADMTGDGLADLVRVRNGELCYWPNLGYGRFGAKVTMDGAPLFDRADAFTARRVRLADLDGTGAADLVYLGADGVRIWFNRCGNSFSAPTALTGLPGFDDTISVATVDLLGAGTTCLAWSCSRPGEQGRQLRYVNLLPNGKPHLLTGYANNLGAQTTLSYATSTRFYLQDRLAGRPWLTKLAFPVHVVARRQVDDLISGTRLVSSYAYHHGYFDGVEREFRGFAMVEQSDAEFVAAASGTGSFTEVPSTRDAEFVLPPVRTCTWLHTGAFVGQRDLATALAAEYWHGDPAAPQLGDTVLPGDAGITAEDLRQACRALRGKTLRTEVYAKDGPPGEALPYSVSTTRYQVGRLQPARDAGFGSFLASELETLTASYERIAHDPRVRHTLNLEIDGFGTVRKSAVVGYPRRLAAFVQQSTPLVSYTEHDVVHVTDQHDWYRIAVPIETREYELGLAAPAGPVAPATLLTAATGSVTVGYEQPVGVGQRRLFGRSRTVYRSDDLASVLPAGAAESLALVDRTYTLGLTASAATAYYAGTNADPTAIALAEGGWVELDGDGSWWAPANRTIYSADPAHPDAGFAGAHFYLPQGELDPFGSLTTLAWDPHDQVPVRRTDPAGNTTVAQITYRLMHPWLVTDPNLNRTGVRFDELGMVTASAAMGKATASGDEADHLDTSRVESAPGDDPTQTFEYDLTAFAGWAADPARDPARPAPAWVHTRSRVRHRDPATPWLSSYAYSDGFGRVVLEKAQAEPGPAPERDAAGALVRDGAGSLVFRATSDRWVGSGRVVHDNKGNVVKRYEPFFDSSAGYESEADLVQWGVTAITRYDPLSRAIRIDAPDGSYSTNEFDAWRQLISDQNDTVPTSRWYAARTGGGLGADQQDAATKASAHANTPHVADLDPLGRMFRSVDDGPAGQLVTHHLLDIQGRVHTVVDALGREALRTEYDLHGTALHTTSIDAGHRWSLVDAGNNPLRQWDSRNQQVRHSYDAARRPSATFLSVGGAAEISCTELSYGEGVPHDTDNNLRGVVHELRDQAGIASTSARDLHGNVLTTVRQFIADPTSEVDWAQPPGLAADRLATTTTYDALSRVVSVTTPDGSISRPVFNERSLLASLAVQFRGGAVTAFVSSVSYDPKAQRQQIRYGNGAVTDYSYDPETFRLNRLVTSRPGAGGPVQDFGYTYDPVGNVTRTADAAQSTVFFANQLLAPAGDYAYDANYRLVAAAGREHIGQRTGWDDSSRQVTALPSDPGAMRNYTEAYVYDLVGNLTSVAHTAAGGSWTRAYRYDEPNAVPATNRLTSTQVGGTVEPYGYDPNGSIVSMPHLSAQSWDYRNQLRSTASQLAAGPVPTTWYRYDAAKGRLRKALVRADGTLAAERLYLGAFERYREYAADGSTVTLERQTLIVPDGTRQLALLEATVTDAAHPGALATAVTRYQFADRLGSSCVELDENAAVISYEEYYPYGSTSFQAGRSQAEVSLKRYRFTGRERDSETGFGYHGMRYYAPWLGRWISTDPAGLVEGTALYSYSRDNPVRLVDPAGTDSTDPAAEPVPPPTSPVSTFGITPGGTSSGYYSFGANRAWQPESAFGLVGQAGAVVGLTDILQLQLSAGPLLGGQQGTPDVHGVLGNFQLQLNTSKEPHAQNTFFVLAGNLADQQVGNSVTAVGGAAVTVGHEWITVRDPGFSMNDYNHPRLQWDVNAVPAVALGAGGIRANSTFDWQVTGTASGSVTRSWGYGHDALAPGSGFGASNIPRYTLGADILLTGGGGRVTGATVGGGTESHGAFTGTAGVDVFGSFTSPRLDNGNGEGNNRITFGWSVGGFVSYDGSGLNGAGAVGGGVRALVIVTFGRGAARPPATSASP